MGTNNQFKHVCFDLDGTIVNSYRTIYKTTIKALEELNINTSFPEQEFQNMIGYHFIDIFEALNIPNVDFEEFIEIYKKRYFDFINESSLYEGLNKTLIEIKNLGIKISLLTTKGQEQADKIINHFNLRKYFDLVMGRRDGIAHKPSPEPLQIICRKLKIEPGNSLMVGDTELDIECGKNANAKTCAACYGYRTEEQLKLNKPDYLIQSIEDLICVLVPQKNSTLK